MKNQNPRGGTELQFEYLKKYVDSKLLDQVQITTSVPEKIPLSKDKINILWQKNSYDNPILHLGLMIKTTIKNMIGTFLILIGIMKNLDTYLIYQLKNVWL